MNRLDFEIKVTTRPNTYCQKTALGAILSP